MTYLNAIKYINAAREGISCDDTLARLLALVGNPQRRVKYLRLAGSNGKTVCAEMLCGVLERSGYLTGCLKMPIAEDMRENIRIGSKCIDMQDFANCTDIIKQAIATHNQELLSVEGEPARKPLEPTGAEVLLTVALMSFVGAHCEVAIIESDHCGNDPSRTLPPPFAAVICGTIPSSDTKQISRIRSYIGKGIEEIVSAPQDSEAYKIISDTCYAAGCRLTLPSRAEISVEKLTFKGCKFKYKGREYSINLCGRFQIMNAVLALEVIEMLIRRGFEIDHEAIEGGFESLRIPAKVEVVSIKPVMIIDSTHTPEAVKIVTESVAEFCEQMGKRVRLCVPSGALADVYVRELTSHGFFIESVICAAGERPADELLPVENYKTPKAAAKKCLAALDKDTSLMISGEYPFVSALRYELLALLGY